MKKGSMIVMAVVLAVSMMAFAAFASAAPQQGTCGNVTFAVAPSSGPPGAMATGSGGGAMQNDSVTFHWDTAGGTQVGSASTDQYGNFSGAINIPVDATIGDHYIVLNGFDPQENPVECPQPFKVVAATAAGGVQPDAYLSVTALPATGLTVIAPAAGLLFTGAALFYRRRSRR